MRRAFYIFIAAFSVTYYMLVSSGVFGVKPGLPEYSMYALPLLNASFAALVLALYEAITSRPGARILGWTWFAAVGIFCAGYWINAMSSYLTSFVITEGQAVDAAYVQRFGFDNYFGKRADAPTIDIRLSGVEHEALQGGAARVKARLLAGGRQVSIEEGEIEEYGDMSMRIGETGYSPRYELTKDGALLDSAFVSLDISPPGKEDSFMLISPHVYYLRYYPAEENGSPPHYRLRVTRNKQLVYDGDLAPSEPARLEDAYMAFPEMRRWVVVTLRREPGKRLMAAGMAIGLAALGAVYLRGRGGAPPARP